MDTAMQAYRRLKALFIRYMLPPRPLWLAVNYIPWEDSRRPYCPDQKLVGQLGPFSIPYTIPTLRTHGRVAAGKLARVGNATGKLYNGA